MAGAHDGHRSRMRERFRREGLNGFADHEALELMLFYAIPQRNVNPLAHRLLDTFGSLHGVLDAPRLDYAVRLEGPVVAEVERLAADGMRVKDACGQVAAEHPAVSRRELYDAVLRARA